MKTVNKHDTTKPQKVANVLRMMAQTTTTVAGLIESKEPAERKIGRLMWRTCVVEGYIPWLIKQYKEWSEKKS